MQSTLRVAQRQKITASFMLLLTIVSVFLAGCSSATDSPVASGSMATTPAHSEPVCLATEFFPIPFEQGLMRYPLVRELGRQSVLIAARDGLGLPTRDQTLGELFPADADKRIGPFALQVRAYFDGNGSLGLLPASTADAPGQTPAELGHYEFNFRSDNYNMYTALAAVLGRASRVELINILRRAGCIGQAVKQDADGPLPDGVESLLAEMDFVAQHAALRQIHDAITHQGESSARLGGLVRGYANLAMLTRHHWTSASAAFAARALLYAERMVTLGSKARLALAHRAYARALVGLHGAALQDLEKLSAENAHANTLNNLSWTEVIGPFCRFDSESLLKLATTHGLAQLAPQLAFETKARYGDPRWTAEIGRKAARQCPMSFGIYAELADKPLMLVQRGAVKKSLEVFGHHLPRSVARLPDLPESVEKFVGHLSVSKDGIASDNVDRQPQSSAFSPLPMRIAKTLREANSTSQRVGEPSWGVLAQLIADEQFLLSANCLKVSLIGVESSKQDLVGRIKPLVEDHPYAPYVQCFAIDGRRQPTELARLLGQIKVKDPRGCMRPLFETYGDATDASGMTYTALSYEALWQRDYHFSALNESLNGVYDSWWKASDLIDDFQRLAVDLQAISPHAPNILPLEIHTTVDPNDKLLADWERRANGHPAALSQIAKIHNNNNHLDAAIRCFERSYDLSPSVETTLSLASAYRDNKQSKEQLSTLNRYLGVKDFNLGHSTIHRHIALNHIARREWVEAEPHALKSAKTWSTMGLVTASRVYEGMGRWKESERWIREATVNYSIYNGMEWYLWCCRTGRGDRKQAKLHANDFLQHSWLSRQESHVNYPFLNDMIDSRYEDALKRIVRTPICDTDLGWQMQVAILAKQLGRDNVYEQAMTQVRHLGEELREAKPTVHSMVVILVDSSKESVFTEDQLAEADELLDNCSNAVRCDFAYYFGESLALQGNTELAEAYWRKALESGQFDNRNATLAGWRLVGIRGVSRSEEIRPADAQ